MDNGVCLKGMNNASKVSIHFKLVTKNNIAILIPESIDDTGPYFSYINMGKIWNCIIGLTSKIDC